MENLCLVRLSIMPKEEINKINWLYPQNNILGV